MASKTLSLSRQDFASLVASPWLPASLAGGFFCALALAVIAVAFLGDPFAYRASLVVPIETKAPAPSAEAVPPPPAASADLVIDVMQTRRAIDDQLAALERLALRRGRAIGVAGAYPVSIERLAAWAKTLEAKGIALAPVSAMLAGDEPLPAAAP